MKRMCSDCYVVWKAWLITSLTAIEATVAFEMHEECVKVATDFLEFYGAKREAA